MYREPIRYCSYCKGEIGDEAVVVRGEETYHLECYRQMNLYVDEFGEVIPYYDTEEED